MTFEIVLMTFEMCRCVNVICVDVSMTFEIVSMTFEMLKTKNRFTHYKYAMELFVQYTIVDPEVLI